MTELEIKAAVRERDGMACVECGMTADAHVAMFGKTLDVHRVVPGSEYTVDGCVAVCRLCHASLPKSPHGSCLNDPDGRQMRVHPLIALMLDELASRNATTAPQEGNRAMRELLQKEGLWPPPPAIVEKWEKIQAAKGKARKPGKRKS